MASHLVQQLHLPVTTTKDLEESSGNSYPQTRQRSTSCQKLQTNLPAICHLYKLFERLVLNRLGPITEQHLIPEQAGFRPGRSCTGQVLNLTQFIEDGYERNQPTGVVFVDLTAAYDTVNHRLLLNKLYMMKRDIHLTKLVQLHS